MKKIAPHPRKNRVPDCEMIKTFWRFSEDLYSKLSTFNKKLAVINYFHHSSIFDTYE